MQTFKVLLASRPKILSEVLSTMVEQQPDMKVYGEVYDPLELLVITREIIVDVIIVTPLETDRESRICSHLLEAQPHLKVVTVSAKGDSACLYQSGQKKKCFNEASWQRILDAIRGSATMCK